MNEPEPAKEIYKRRAATSECVNAIARNRGLRQFLVRGLAKAKAILLWFAVAHTDARRRAPAGSSTGMSAQTGVAIAEQSHRPSQQALSARE